MPDTPANQSEFPQSKTQKAGLGFPLTRLVAIISLSCGAVLEWATGPCEGKRTGETAPLWQRVPHFRPGDIAIADRYFSGYFMLAWLIRHGVDVVVRQHQLRHTDFRRGRRLGAKDHVVAWAGAQRPAWMDAATYAAMPETLHLREARVGGLTLVTSLIEAGQVSKKDLLILYHARWQVELDLRSIKTVMQMGVLRCKSPEMVKKELAVHLLAYNLIRAVMAQAAFLGHVLPRQLSFKATCNWSVPSRKTCAMHHADGWPYAALISSPESLDCACQTGQAGSNLAPSSDELNRNHSSLNPA